MGGLWIVVLLVPLALAALVAPAADAEARALATRRSRELASRLGAVPPVADLPPRLVGLRAQHGPRVLAVAMRILRDQGIDPLDPPSLAGVGGLVPWLGRVLAQGALVTPRLVDVALYAQATHLDVLPLSVAEVTRGLAAWTRAIQAQVEAILAEQRIGVEDRAARAALVPWLFARVAHGEHGPWPALLLVADWAGATGEPVPPTLSVHGAMEAAARWHGMDAPASAAWEAWGERVRQARARGWAPRPGTLLRVFPGGLRLERLETRAHLDDESTLMDHCVGRGIHGDTYTQAIAAGTSEIWSLRLPDGIPVVTIEMVRSRRGGPLDQARQVYGPRNTPVHPAYATAIFDLFSDRFDALPSHLQREYALRYARRGTPSFQAVLRSGPLLFAWATREGPRDDTRAAAVALGPPVALEYALTVDAGPHPVTRAAVLGPLGDGDRPGSEGGNHRAKAAYTWAVDVEKAPAAESRALASLSPGFALDYARLVDRAPSPVTLRGALGDAGIAERYADAFPGFIADLEAMVVAEAPPLTVARFFSRRSLPPAARDRVREDPFAAVIAVETHPALLEEILPALYRDPRTATFVDSRVLARSTAQGRAAAARSPWTAASYADDVEGGEDGGPVSPVLIEAIAGASAATLAALRAWPPVPLSAGLGHLLALAGWAAVDPAPPLALLAEVLGWTAWAKDPTPPPVLLAALAREYAARDPGDRVPGLALGRVVLRWPGLLADPGGAPWARDPAVLEALLTDRTYVPRPEAREAVVAQLRTLFAQDPGVRARAIRFSPAGARGILVAIDGGRWTREVVLSLARDSAEGIAALRKLGLPPWSTVPAAIRGGFSPGVAHRLYRVISASRTRAHGGRTESSDPLPGIVDRVVQGSVEALAQALSSRPPRSWAERVARAQAIEAARAWCQVGGSMESPPAAFQALATRLDPAFLAWIDPGFFVYGDPSPATPLPGATEGGLPPVLYVGARGRPGGERGIHVPPWTDDSPGARVTRGGAEAFVDGGPTPVLAQVVRWVRDQAGPRARALRDRLGDVPGAPGQAPRDRADVTLASELAVIFAARTALDAEWVHESPVVVAIDPSATPLLTWLPWRTPAGATGVCLVYAAESPRTAQVPDKARGDTLTRWTGAIP